MNLVEHPSGHNDDTLGNDVEGLLKHAFSAKFRSCQASGGQTGQCGGQTGQLWRSDRITLGFGHWRSDRPMVGGLTGP